MYKGSLEINLLWLASTILEDSILFASSWAATGQVSSALWISVGPLLDELEGCDRKCAVLGLWDTEKNVPSSSGIIQTYTSSLWWQKEVNNDTFSAFCLSGRGVKPLPGQAPCFWAAQSWGIWWGSLGHWETAAPGEVQGGHSECFYCRQGRFWEGSYRIGPSGCKWFCSTTILPSEELPPLCLAFIH